MELKVIIGINGKKTEKYELQLLHADLVTNNLEILLKTKEPNQANDLVPNEN